MIKLRSIPARFRTVLASAFAALAAPLASAQTLDLTASIGNFGTAITGTITTNSPVLFSLLALAVGFYFIWGRVRSLF